MRDILKSLTAEQLAKFQTCKTVGDVLAVGEKEQLNLSEAEVQAIHASLQLTDEDLEGIV